MPDILLLASKINSPELQQAILFFKIPILILDVLIVAFILYILTHSSWLQHSYLYNFNEFLSFTPYGARRLSKRWQVISDRLNSGLESEYKLAIIDADAMFDEAMIKLGIAGETPEERIQNVSPAIVPNLTDIAQVHEIRNHVVRDPNFRLSGREANRVVSVYQKTFENLDLI
tara:strand:- start:129 stop:647 length:519 start_codon:yes stop_codon:yes gene_type:complete